MSDYPRMLYRPGSMLRWHGHDVDHMVVDNEREEAEAISQGWNLSPDALDHDGDGRKGGKPRKRGRKKKAVSDAGS